ncbi:MAG: cupredoxin domain-containing protein [Paludibacter sp.]|nr:cupredoxin domain-containing protein [Paludibacter sp.]
MSSFNKHSEKSGLLALSIVCLFIFFSSSCSSTSEPPANEVYIQNMAFTPVTLTVSVGTTVKWTNKDAVAHTVTSDTPGQFDSGNISANGVYSYMFMTAGTFNYHCAIHTSMTAKVIVK